MKTFQQYLITAEEIGFVEACNQSIVYASGLPNATLQEIVMFESGELGVILSMSRDQVEILLLSKSAIKAGIRVTRTGAKQEMPVGFELLGKVVDPFGHPLNASQTIEKPKISRPIDISPSGINTRKRIEQAFETGVTVVDMLIPLGKGQRQLVIGDRKTGKTSFLYQTMLKQASLGTICIYAGIGRKKTDIKKIESFFHAVGIENNTVIIATSSEDPAGVIYLTPYAAMTLAEYFRDEGHDVLVVMDDLFTHAKFYREIMLIGRRFPGRNAYPADIFYTHARLLERAGNFVLANGSEHAITCLPVVESVEGDIAGFIQTNLMSMTDGHIYFDVDMFTKGNRPAINPFVSVSRVGRQTQSPLRLTLNRELISFLTLHRKLESFSHFSAEAGPEVKRTLAVAERIFAFFNQGPTEVKNLDLQIVVFCLLWADYWQDLTKLEKDIATINETYKNSLAAQSLVKELVSGANSLNELLMAVRKQQDKILNVFGVQIVTVTIFNMNYLKNILLQIEDLTGIKDIVGASEEIASMKMRSIRTKVLLSRDLNDELTEIYREVSTSYKNQIVQLMEQKKGKALQQVSASQLALKTGNGEHACVYLSANSGLFNKILERTYHEFTAYLDQHKEATPVIIGEFGKNLFINEFPGRPFIFYPLAEGRSSESALKKITEDLADYSSVIIFYARFESMAQQTTTVLDVSGQDPLTAQPPQQIPGAQPTAVSASHYLFEPSLEKIIIFFETEIFAGIIQQTVTESELARYASRITTLDMARENINQQLRSVNLERRFAQHRLMNKKQTEALTGISLWNIR